MDETWLLRAVSYVELNPVKAGMVKHAWDYRWSSVHAHLAGNADTGFVVTEPLLNLVGNWKDYLTAAQSHGTEELSRHERTGRPLGTDGFLEMAEKRLGRVLRKKKPGPKASEDR